MMHPDLAGVWARLDHSDKHSAAMLSAIDDYLYSGVIKPRFSYDPEQSVVLLTLEDYEGPPEIALTAGDALQAVRSALNNVIIAMVRRAGAQSTRVHQFPIESRSNSRGRRELRSQVEGISQEDLRIVSRFQPSTWPASERDFHPFEQLRELTNWDKHQQLLLPGAQLHKHKKNAYGIYTRISSLTDLRPDEEWEIYAPFPLVNRLPLKPYVTGASWGGEGDPYLWRLEVHPLPHDPVFSHPPLPIGVRIASDDTATDDFGITRIQEMARHFVTEVEASWLAQDGLAGPNDETPPTPTHPEVRDAGGI